MSQSSQGRNRDGRVSEAIAGLLILGGSTTVGLTTVLWGQGIVAGQISPPVVGGVFWPASVGLTILLTVVMMLLITMVLLGIVDGFATPRLFGRSEYTLIGLGGMVGSSVGVAVSLAGHFVHDAALPLALPSHGGVSMTALAMVATPAALTYYWFWRPADAPIVPPRSEVDQNPPDPEIIRERRTKWADDADPDAAPAPMPTLPDQEQPQVMPSTDQSDDRLNTENLAFPWVRETNVSFDDIGGMTDLKEELKIDVIKPLTSGKEKAEALDIPLPNVLFHGPPGTGKTHLAKGLASELGLPFVQLSGSDVQSKWINESPQKIGSLFEEAKQVAAKEGGALVFFDELDSVLTARSGGGNSHNEDNKVTNEFLNHLQDTGEHDVVFVGATNRMNILDEAGIRSGRIDKTVEFRKPDSEARVAIIRAQLRDRPHELQDHHLRTMADQTAGCNAADLESIILQAARQCAFHREADQIQWQDIQSVLDDV